ncbi:MAG: chemotaxis protein CheW [Candidatus Methylomirabilia bacterium]
MVAEGSAVTGRLLAFRAGPGRFAIFLEDVLGVQEPAAAGSGTDRGVVFQGQPVAAVDARMLWREGSGPPETLLPPAVIIVSGGGGTTALMVDCVEGIVEGVEMRPLPALVAPFVRDAFRGVTLHADGGRLVVDPSALAGAAAAGGKRGSGEA